MKRLALILLALGMNVQAAALTLNDARAQGRVGKPSAAILPRFNRMRKRWRWSIVSTRRARKATRSWLTAIICRSMKWRKWRVKNWLPARSRANT
jgi:hypothetical protein